MTVRCASSIWRKCVISATNALRSAFRVSSPNGDMQYMLLPSLSTMRGKRWLSNFAQPGMYCGKVFFQAPNHSSTGRTLCSRAYFSNTLT
jgi:hypothetical protein